MPGTYTGGRTPYDEKEALTGPARVVFAPITTTAPQSLWDILDAKNTNGEYPLKTGWRDLGLAADAPSYTHAKETEGIEYQQPTSVLFEQISSVTRTFVAQIGGISPENLALLENSQAGIDAIAAATNKSALKQVGIGSYDEFVEYRAACISYRPSGAGTVIEPDGTVRPPAVALILGKVRMAAEDSEVTWERGTPVNSAVSFTSFADPVAYADPRKQNGFWAVEQPGTIAGT